MFFVCLFVVVVEGGGGVGVRRGGWEERPAWPGC